MAHLLLRPLNALHPSSPPEIGEPEVDHRVERSQENDAAWTTCRWGYRHDLSEEVLQVGLFVGEIVAGHPSIVVRALLLGYSLDAAAPQEQMRHSAASWAHTLA